MRKAPAKNIQMQKIYKHYKALNRLHFSYSKDVRRFLNGLKISS